MNKNLEAYRNRTLSEGIHKNIKVRDENTQEGVFILSTTID